VKADFNPISLEAATIDGKIYWVKMIDDTGAFYYKPSVFKDKGLEPAKTLDDVLNIAKTLNDGRVKGMFLGNDGGIGAAGGLLMWSGGADYFDESGKKVAFNTASVATGFSKLKELNDSGALLIGAPTDYWDPSAFIQGLAATQWTGMWALPAIQKALGDDVDIFPWPATDASGKASTFWGGWGECVNGKTKYPDAAKALTQFLWIDSTDIQQEWALSYGFHVPPRKSAAASAEQLKSGPAAKFVENLNSYGRITPPLWDAAMGTAYTQALTNVIQSGKDPQTELDAAAKTAQTELDRLLGS
jgi:multiple sugar transport system substrate-binding protein